MLHLARTTTWIHTCMNWLEYKPWPTSMWTQTWLVGWGIQQQVGNFTFFVVIVVVWLKNPLTSLCYLHLKKSSHLWCLKVKAHNWHLQYLRFNCWRMDLCCMSYPLSARLFVDHQIKSKKNHLSKATPLPYNMRNVTNCLFFVFNSVCVSVWNSCFVSEHADASKIHDSSIIPHIRI